LFEILKRRYAEIDLLGLGPRIGGGQYRLIARRPDGTVRDSGWFDNVITNAGLNRLGTHSDDYNTTIINFISVGTGNATPAITDTTLQTKVAHTNAVASGGGYTFLQTSPYHITYEHPRSFPQGSVVGNLAEVGAGWDGTTLFSRALVKDGSGNPTTFPVTAIDQLDVYYKFRLYPPLGDTNFSINVSGTQITGVGRATGLTTAGDVYGAGRNTWPPPVIRCAPRPLATHPMLGYVNYWGMVCATGSTLGALNAAGPTYTAHADLPDGGALEGSYIQDSFYRDVRVSLGTASGNVTGGLIGALYLGNGMGHYQFVWDNGVPKDDTRSFTMVYRLSWGRYP
jgi:hypothetical protein